MSVRLGEEIQEVLRRGEVELSALWLDSLFGGGPTPSGPPNPRRRGFLKASEPSRMLARRRFMVVGTSRRNLSVVPSPVPSYTQQAGR